MDFSASSQAYSSRGTGESGPLFSNSDYPCFETHPTTFAVCSKHQFEKKKKMRDQFRIYIAVSSEKMAYFSDEWRPKLILRTRRCIAKKTTPLLKQRQTSLDASRKKASRSLRRAGPILPLPGPNTPAKMPTPPFSVFINDFTIKDGRSACFSSMGTLSPGFVTGQTPPPLFFADRIESG